MKKLGLLLIVLFVPAAGAAYKCVDEKGITHIGDVPPDRCADVVMFEIGPSGAILRKIDPTPTPEQLKAREEEFERTRNSLRGQAEQKRKDTALLSTFSNEKEFDVARDRNIDPIRGRIKSAEDRIKAVEKRQKELEEEMEFYSAGKSKTKSMTPPVQLSSDLSRIRGEQAALKSNIANYEKEIERVKEKFDADKKRWIALKNPAPTKPAEPEAKADGKPAAKSDAKPPKKG